MTGSMKETSIPVLTPSLTGVAFGEAVLCSIGSCLNFILIYLLLWDLKGTLKRSNLVLLLNLAVWDFFFASFILSMTVKKLVSGLVFLNPNDCLMEGVLNEILGMNSFFAIVLLSLDRYITVVKKKLLSLQRCMLSIVFTVLMASIIAVSPFFFDPEHAFVLQPSGYYCLVDLSRRNPKMEYAFYVVAGFYVFCMLTSMASYVRIFMVIKKTQFMLRNIHGLKNVDTEVFSMTSSSARRTIPHSTEESKSKLATELIMKKKNLNPKTLPTFTSNPTDTQSRKPSMIAFSTNSAAKSRRALDMQLTKKTIFIGTSHILVWTPFAICGILQMAQVPDLEVLDFVAIFTFFLGLILDPLWSLTLDQHVRKRMAMILHRHPNHS